MALRTGEYDTANEVLDTIARGARPLTTDDVDDVFWAIDQLDRRNTAIRESLDHEADSVLTNEDIRGLECSLEAIRRFFRWVGDTDPSVQASSTSGPPSRRRRFAQLQEERDARRYEVVAQPYEEHERQRSLRPSAIDDGDRQGRVGTVGVAPAVREAPRSSESDEPPRGRPKETLRTVAEEAGITVQELRYHNPDLEVFGADDQLPGGVKIRLPAPQRQHHQPRVHSSKDRRVVSRAQESETREEVRRHRATNAARSTLTRRQDDDADRFSFRETPSMSSDASDYDEPPPPKPRRSVSTARRRSVSNGAGSDGRAGRRSQPSTSALDLSVIAHQKLVEGELTLEVLARACKLPIDEILRQNPNLETYGDNEVIPYHEPIEVRRPENGTRVADLVHQPTRRSKAIARLGDTLRSIAERIARCSIEELRAVNRGTEAESYANDEMLPMGMSVYLPPSYSDQLRASRAMERDLYVKEASLSRRQDDRGSASYRGDSETESSLSRQTDDEPPRRPSRNDEYRPGEWRAAGTADVHGARSLAELAEEFGCSIQALRDSNPETDPFSEDEFLPRGSHVRVPFPQSQRRGHSSSRTGIAASPRRQSTVSGRPHAPLEKHYTTFKGETLSEIGWHLGIHPDRLFELNEDILDSRVRNDSPLPAGLTLQTQEPKPSRTSSRSSFRRGIRV